jgi:hypothetical protein
LRTGQRRLREPVLRALVTGERAPDRPHGSGPFGIYIFAERTVVIRGTPSIPLRRMQMEIRALTVGDGRRADQVMHAEVPSWSLACPLLARAQRPGCWGTGEGCVVQLLVNVDEDGIVFDLACVNRDGAAGKWADGLASGQVVA